MKTRLDIQNYGCNGNLLCYHGVVERNRISSLQSHGKALEKECCLPGVFCDSGDTPANLLCELSGHLMPCASCFYGKWVEDVCAGQFGVFVYLVLRCLLGCCTWFSCCVANVRLSICVWYCHVPGHWLSSGPWQESGSIWAFVVIPHHVDWLFNCWHLGSLDCSPQDVIQMTVTLLSGSASVAG